MSWTFTIAAPPALDAISVLVHNPDYGGSVERNRPQAVGASDGGTIHVQDLGPDQRHIDVGWNNLTQTEYLQLDHFFSNRGTRMQRHTFALAIAGQCQQPQFVGCGDVIGGVSVGCGDTLPSGDNLGCGDVVTPDVVSFVGVRLRQGGVNFQDSTGDLYALSIRMRLAEE